MYVVDTLSRSTVNRQDDAFDDDFNYQLNWLVNLFDHFKYIVNSLRFKLRKMSL